jgi:hypothetical protein
VTVVSAGNGASIEKGRLKADPSRKGTTVGSWIYTDAQARYEGERALEAALAAEGKRNLFHDDVLLQLEWRDRLLDCPPLVKERRLLLTAIPASWPYPVGEPCQMWVSDPILEVATRPHWVNRQQLNEVLARAVARRFFARVHDELHFLAKQQITSPRLTAAV